MGTSTEKPGYIPLMIFSVLFTCFVVLFACRCRYRSRNNKIKNSSAPNKRNIISLNNMADMPAVEQQRYSPVVQSPAVTVDCVLGLDQGSEDQPGDDYDRNGAHSIPNTRV